jgi:hypothetical protein
VATRFTREEVDLLTHRMENEIEFWRHVRENYPDDKPVEQLCELMIEQRVSIIRKLTLSDTELAVLSGVPLS